MSLQQNTRHWREHLAEKKSITSPHMHAAESTNIDARQLKPDLDPRLAHCEKIGRCSKQHTPTDHSKQEAGRGYMPQNHKQWEGQRALSPAQ